MGAPRPSGPPGGIGPAGAPGPMAGNQASGMAKLQAGLKALMEALPQIPIGSELSNAVMDAVSKIGKHLPEGGVGGGANLIQQLALMAREAKGQPNPMAAMGGGTPSAAPPTGAGAPPPAMGA